MFNAFRRLVWMGAGPPSAEPDEHDQRLTKDVAAFQAVFAPLLTFQLRWWG
jgi:hypothetical protein